MREPRAPALGAALIMLTALAVLELTARLIPVPHAGALLCLIIVAIAYRSGVPGGLVAALFAVTAVAVGDAAGSVLLPGAGPLAVRIAVAAVAFPGVALLVGMLRRRSGRRLEQEIAARDAALVTERRFRQLVDNLQAVVWEGDPETYAVSFVGGAAERAFGYPRGLWLGDPGFWRRLIHPEDYEAVLAACTDAARRGEDHELEYRVVTQDGETRWVRDLVRVEHARDGRPSRLCGVLVDVTARRASEIELRETKDRLRRILDQAADALFVYDPEGRIVEVNDRACERLGYAREELLAMRMADIQPEPGHLPLPDGPLDLLTHVGVHRRRDGTTFPIEVRAGVIQWRSRAVVVAIARDVSERMRLEEQLRMSQKMEAVGLLAGGIAHDFNNLLTAIKGHIEMLLLETEPGDVVRADLEEIAKAADRAAELTRQLLAFSRRQIFTPAPLDLRLLVEELHPVFERMAGDSVRLTTGGESTFPVHADRGQIEQVLLVLVSNALEAMPDGGELRVATHDQRVERGDALLRRHPYVVPGEYLVISVSDTGHGMDAATLARIFEPFYSTRTKDHAAGLGLSTAYGIVKQSDGYIIADSAPGAGTTLSVYLPRAGSALPDPATGSDPTRHRDPDRLVLVVEDEPAVRALIGRVLVKKGYAVIEAANGREALQLAGDATRPVDLLISDIVMPEMDGPELARRLADVRPGIPVLLISGYSHDAIVREGGFPPGTAFLGKPFTPSELATRVEEILSR